MAKDITIANASFPDVPAIQCPITGGGIATFTEGIWSPFGADLELLNTYDMGTTKLKDTGFNSWTPSTTAKSIQATSTLGTITSPALNTYEYLILTKFQSDIAYASGTTLVAAVVKQIIEMAQIVHRKPSNSTNMGTATDNYNYCATAYTAPWMDYYDTSGARKATWTGSYGIYPGATAATFGSTTGENTTITVKAPTYNARCYKSYFKEAMASAVDKDASTIKCKVYVYRFRKDSDLLKFMYKDIVGIYNNGF